MKTRNLLIALLLVFLCVGRSHAQTQPAEDALLWKVSGNGLETPSYIYGTIHMLCEEDFIISDKLTTALENAERVTFELDMGAADLMAQMQASMVAEVPLSKKLSAEEYQTLDSIVQLKTAMSLQMLDNMSLQAISSIMMIKSLPCESPKSYEFELLEMAKKQEKEVSGLETVAEQMNYFDKAFSDEFLLDQLFNFNEHQETFEKMVASYKKEELQKLYTYVIDERYADTDTEKWLLVERNKKWVERIPELIEKESNLIAVGAAHLAGENGIIELLRSEGYTVQPLKE